ncbi:MAG: hypothetical protein FWB78_00875 [Treponema sp.]|nr:hypothetical protein [Treponema sp.]
MGKLMGLIVFVVLGGLLSGCGTVARTPPPEVLGTTHVVVMFPAEIERRMGWDMGRVTDFPRNGVSAPGYRLWIWDNVQCPTHVTVALLHFGAVMDCGSGTVFTLDGHRISIGAVGPTEREVNLNSSSPITPTREREIDAYIARHPLRESGYVTVYGNSTLLLRHLTVLERAVGRPASIGITEGQANMWLVWDDMYTRTHIIETLLSRGAMQGSDCWHVLLMGGHRITLSNTIVCPR